MVLTITESVLVATIIGLGGLLFKTAVCHYKTHKTQHNKMEEYEQLFEMHKKLHIDIKNKLEMSSKVDIVTMRTQLLQIYTIIKDDPDNLYWKQQFYDMYNVYIENGGNSFAHDLKHNVDNI